MVIRSAFPGSRKDHGLIAGTSIAHVIPSGAGQDEFSRNVSGQIRSQAFYRTTET